MLQHIYIYMCIQKNTREKYYATCTMPKIAKTCTAVHHFWMSSCMCMGLQVCPSLESMRWVSTTPRDLVTVSQTVFCHFASMMISTCLHVSGVYDIYTLPFCQCLGWRT